MAGPVPAIHGLSRDMKNVGARDKPGHDGERDCKGSEQIRRRLALRRIVSSSLHPALRLHARLHGFGRDWKRADTGATGLEDGVPMAGATTVTAGSPTPVAFSPLAITATATSGVWLMRSGL